MFNQTEAKYETLHLQKGFQFQLHDILQKIHSEFSRNALAYEKGTKLSAPQQNHLYIKSTLRLHSICLNRIQRCKQLNKFVGPLIQ